MKLKKSSLKNVISIVLAIFIVIGWSFGTSTNSYAAGETYTIKASEIKTKESQYYHYEAKEDCLYIYCGTYNIDLDMDSDLTLKGVDYKSISKESSKYNFTVKGNKKLTIDGEFCMISNYIQENGSNVVITNGDFYTVGSATIKSGANMYVENLYDDEFCSAAFFCIDQLSIAGNVTINSSYNGMMSGSGIAISGGETRINSKYFGIGASKNLDITGGSVYSNVEHVSINAGGSINISGGYVETTVKNTVDYYNIFAPTINIVDPMYIKSPAGGKIDDVIPYYPVLDDTQKAILDADGICPDNIVIGNKVSEQKAAEEEAAKKAAEEEAAKKAAEEEAAKKAAEEEAAAKKAAEEAVAKKSNDETTNNASEDTTTKANEDTTSTTSSYCNEWVDGRWYNAAGVCDYSGVLEWKCNSTGWWVEDTNGWYPVSQWVKIDGKWYYFLGSGYMDYSEYRDGYWLGSDGALVDGYYGQWKSDATGWWFEDTSGWYPVSQWLWINGSCYYFESTGYMATNKYIDGYWVGADGAYK